MVVNAFPALSLLKHVVLERAVKFTAVVGRSDFALSPILIDLGSTRTRGKKFSGNFTISNLSTLLPLHYSIEPTKKVVLSRMSGTLDGLEVPNGRSQERTLLLLHPHIHAHITCSATLHCS